MPSYFEIHGYRVYIYRNDHRPAHIHVRGPDGTVVFILNCKTSGPLEGRERWGIADDMVRKLARAITPEIKRLCAAWRKDNGYY